jgi:hypothetical protein
MYRTHNEGLRPDGLATFKMKLLEALPSGISNCTALFFFVLAILSFRYNALQTHYQAAKNKSGNGSKEAPPTVPYVFPFLGTVPLAYVWSPIAFVLNPK